ncbi:MAG: hypothetical protein ACLPUT_14855 [Solirubrobacteraceae bacterium]
MTLLRRAPREVYRVYGEEEFLACADRDERSESTTSGAGERRLHRVAGATMLLAVAGAVGGLIAITSLSAAAGARRRVGARLLAATGSFTSSRVARAHVWREPAGSGWSAQRRMQESHAGPVRVAPRTRAPRRAAAPQLAIASERTPVVAVRRQGTPIAVATPAQAVRLTASAAAQSQRSGQSEFGFER